MTEWIPLWVGIGIFIIVIWLLWWMGPAIATEQDD